MTQSTGQHDFASLDASNPKTIIEMLERSGLKVHVSHLRQPDGLKYPTGSTHALKAMGFKPDPKGGATRVLIADADGNRLSSGLAACSPRDNFDRKLGTRIALGRALKGLT